MSSASKSALPPPYEPGDGTSNVSDEPRRWATVSDPPAFDADVVPGYDAATPSKLYKIGKPSTLPLVTIAEIKAHLLLLGAFEQLKQKCEEADVIDVQKKLPPLCTDAKWPLFLERSRERFDLWVAKVVNARPDRTSLRHEEIPPLDVLLIWHAYLLNPVQYYEDVSRMHPILDRLPEFPLNRISSQIDLETLEMLPTEEQFHYWQRTTGDCFGLPLHTTPDADTIKIACPLCNYINEITWVCAPDASGKLRGYAQRQFLVACENSKCKFMISWDALCTKRFADDVVLCSKNTDVVLGGTLMSASGSPDTLRGRQITEDILGAFVRTSGSVELAESLGWSMQEVSRRLTKEFEGTKSKAKSSGLGQARIPYLLAAYSNPYPRSFCVVSAVQRLSAFTSTLHQLEYLTPGIFDQDAEPLILALERFHGFLDVATRGSSKRPMIPTLDIDLVWHTMMLRPHAYREATLKFLGRVLPHDDLVEEGVANSAFNEEAEIWKERQGTQYSICGCYTHLGAIPSSSSSGVLFWKKSKPETVQQSSQTNYPPDSVNTRLATHPSDHSSVVVKDLELFKWQRERRRERFSEDAAKANEGKGKDPAGAAPEATSEEMQHERAFLRSVTGQPSGLDCWELRITVDPHVVDGKLVNHGYVVVGVDAQATHNEDIHAVTASNGLAIGSAGW